MNEQTLNQLKDALIPVAEKIGQTAEWGWEVVLRQQITYGFVYLFIAIFGVVLLIAIYKILTLKDKDGDSFWDWESNPAPLIIAIFGGFSGISMLISGVINSILYLSNPEYYAIQFFINLVK